MLPELRRRGVGQALIQSVEERARALGLPRIRLGVRTGLAGNLDYFERLGYRQYRAENHPGYSQPTYLLFEKELQLKELTLAWLIAAC